MDKEAVRFNFKPLIGLVVIALATGAKIAVNAWFGVATDMEYWHRGTWDLLYTIGSIVQVGAIFYSIKESRRPG